MDNDDIKKKIGERIRIIREEKGISQQQVAALCDFEKSSMSRIEAGRTNPTLTTLYKISIALDVSLQDIVNL